MDWGNPEFAQVETLSDQYADRILSSPKVKLVRTLYGIVFPLTIIGGVVILLLSKAFFQGSDESSASHRVQFFWLFLLVTVVFGALFVIRLYIGTRNQWLRKVARNEINRRPDKIVNPDAAGIRFVEIVPKSNWNDLTLVDNATDVGFLKIDLQRRCLLYEGDNERYRIPARAIVKCDRDSYARLVQDSWAKSQRNISYYFVVITMKVSDAATVEIPIRIRRPRSPLYDAHGCDENNKLLHEIHQLQNLTGNN